MFLLQVARGFCLLNRCYKGILKGIFSITKSLKWRRYWLQPKLALILRAMSLLSRQGPRLVLRSGDQVWLVVKLSPAGGLLLCIPLLRRISVEILLVGICVKNTTSNLFSLSRPFFIKIDHDDDPQVMETTSLRRLGELGVVVDHSVQPLF